jgi:hypothetical protein
MTTYKGNVRSKPRENRKIVPETVRMVLAGGRSLTIDFCQVKKLKIRDSIIKTGKVKKENKAHE